MPLKAYSVDLRQKIIDAHNQQEGSQRQLAKRFRVSLSFIQDLLKRYRSDGTIEPRAHGGGRSTTLSTEQRTRLRVCPAEDSARDNSLRVQYWQVIGQVNLADLVGNGL